MRRWSEMGGAIRLYLLYGQKSGWHIDWWTVRTLPFIKVRMHTGD